MISLNYIYKNPKVVKTKNRIIILLSSGGKKPKFIKEQKAKRLTSILIGQIMPILSDLFTISKYLVLKV